MAAVARRGLPLLSLALAAAVAWPSPAVAFSGFGSMSADATYGSQMRFTLQLPGGPPDKLELLLRFAGSDSTLVAPVNPGPGSAEYVWDAAARPITPNTAIAYRWRATNGGMVTLSPEKNLLYDDDRPGLDWHTARIGATTVHWYGSAESQARHFGEISANAAAAAETLLGHNLVGPIDIFVYVSQADFFGALGPGAREWTGAATFPQLRTIFMWLGGGSSSYLETTMTHEVTHVVFQDATANPFHDPARWFNEGLAVWSEQQSADAQAAAVRSAADGGTLLAFDGITESFPIGDQAARLSYAEGATMVQMIIDRYGRKAIAAIAAAWRDGAGDGEALEAGTGVKVDQLYRDYFASVGVQAPTAVQPAPILPSNVDKPPQPNASLVAPPSASTGPIGQPSGTAPDLGWVVAIAAAGLALGIAGALIARRRRRPAGPA
jgi:hypothetical protein